MIIYDVFLVLVLACLLLILISNLWIVKRIDSRGVPRQSPLVSILVPARNEERNIESCVSSLLGQTYPNLELIVFDDDSEDQTAEILERIKKSDPRVQVLRGKGLPQGWLGKCYACHELAQAARGEILLFTDADTIHARESVSAAVREMEMTGADLLTLVTQLEMKTFAEKLILPLVYFIAFVYLLFVLVSRLRHPNFAIGNGQFMLFRRSAYERAGGHEAVRTAFVEDVWLARRVKAAGLKLVVRDGSKLVACRMYRGFREIWHGFSKNLFPSVNCSIPFFLAIVLFDIAAYVLPFGFLLAGICLRADPLAWVILPAVQIGMAWLMRILLAVRFRLGIGSCLLHPLGMILLLAIAANSFCWFRLGKGALWKGRRYDFPSVHQQTV